MALLSGGDLGMPGVRAPFNVPDSVRCCTSSRRRLPRSRRRVHVIRWAGEGGKEIGKLPRRRLLVSFRCNKCGQVTNRYVNPLAWEKGAVYCQCGHCSAWHQLKDNLDLVEEIRFVDEDENRSSLNED